MPHWHDYIRQLGNFTQLSRFNGLDGSDEGLRAPFFYDQAVAHLPTRRI
jgi:hypothetical protein